MTVPSIKKQSEYWDATWAKRCRYKGVEVDMNKEKMEFLIECLIKRPYYEHLPKLDVGCGSGIHHTIIWQALPDWDRGLKCIDLSMEGIDQALRFGLDAEVVNFYNYNPNKKFDLFLFLDTLEHFDNLEKTAESVLRLANENFYIFGNVPLYQTTPHAEGGFERKMDKGVLAYFFSLMGIQYFWQKIYGSFGMPYMVFEARRNFKPEETTQFGESVIKVFK